MPLGRIYIALDTGDVVGNPHVRTPALDRSEGLSLVVEAPILRPATFLPPLETSGFSVWLFVSQPSPLFHGSFLCVIHTQELQILNAGHQTTLRSHLKEI